MHGCTDTKVILYSVQCYALHWTDNKIPTKIYASKANVLLLPFFFTKLPEPVAEYLTKSNIPRWILKRVLLLSR